MEKVLVEVFLPAAQRKYDVFIPADSVLHEVRTLLVAVAEDLSEGGYVPLMDAVVCNERGEVYNVNMTVEELGIKNGSRLMLI